MFLCYNVHMKEISLKNISKTVRKPVEELRAMKKDWPELFEAVVMGASLKAQGMDAGEVYFKIRHNMKPDVKAYERENVMLRTEIFKLKNVLKVPEEANDTYCEIL